MLTVLLIILGIFVLTKNTTNPSPNKSTTKTTSAPSLLDIRGIPAGPDGGLRPYPAFYDWTGTDITDNPPTTSVNLNPPVIAKLGTPIASGLASYQGTFNGGLPDVQLAKYQNDAASIAPLPAPNPTFEVTVPKIAATVYKSSVSPIVSQKWLA